MRRLFARRVLFALAVLLSVSLCFDEASAQRRRSKRSRRVTNPVVVPVAPPATTTTTTSADPQIISTADQQASEQDNATQISGQVSEPNARRKTRQRAAQVEEDDSVQRTVNDLSAQVNKLSEKLSQMERQQRTLVDLERLSRAEQRAEALRTQLRDVQEKESNLSARMEQIDYDLKPENIERSVSAYGSTRPEEARDARRRALESEKARMRSQLDLLQTSRQRLETAIVNADAEVERLRKRIEETNDAPQPKTDTTEEADETEETPATRPETGTPAPDRSTPPPGNDE